MLFRSEAIAACRRIVDASLRECYKPDITAGELYEKYDMFGENPFIVAVNHDDKPVTFSAREYAEEKVLVFTG